MRNQYGNLFFLFITEQIIFNEKSSFSCIEIIPNDHHLTKSDLKQIVQQDFQLTNDTVKKHVEKSYAVREYDLMKI